jgi:hypothetical protein
MPAIVFAPTIMCGCRITDIRIESGAQNLSTRMDFVSSGYKGDHVMLISLRALQLEAGVG